MVARRRTAGFSMLEATLALVVVGIVAGALVTGSAAQVRATGAAFRTAAAQRLAAGVLEKARGTELVGGAVDVALDVEHAPPQARAVRCSRELEPGLWEVEAVVTWTEPGESTPRESRLVTWIAREDER